MAKTDYIELGSGDRIPILYEDRSVMAIDKPPGWMLVPVSWQKTDHNLHAAILSSITQKAFWVRSRGLKFLQHVHRLDAETTGILLMVKSQGALRPFAKLFESRNMEKRYLAVVEGRPKRQEWECTLPLGQDPDQIGRVRVDSRDGKDAETHFRTLVAGDRLSLIEAMPVTGRTHQIRVHLAEVGLPISGDPLYGSAQRPAWGTPPAPLGLRSVHLSYVNPFDQRDVVINAPTRQFLSTFGFPPMDVR